MPFPEGGNSLGGGAGGGDGCNIGHLVLDGRFADVGIVMLAELAAGRIDDELNLFVFDPIHNVGPAFMHLQNLFRFHAVLPEEAVRSVCGLDSEAQIPEFPGHFDDPPRSFGLTVIRTVPSLGRTCCAASSAL